MISLLLNGRVDIFVIVAFGLIFSLTFHEFGHAICAKWMGDDTAERLGRITLNPLPHIDPMGALMLFTVGFGWAKPVPTNPRNYTKTWASPAVAFAGPFMNFLIAFVVANAFAISESSGLGFTQSSLSLYFVFYLVNINLLLMLFNLIPLGPLDGHYILSHFLPHNMRSQYLEMNHRYGSFVLLGLVALSFFGVPIFSVLLSISQPIAELITLF